MGALFYLIRRSIINFIKNLKKQPSKLIPFVFIIGMVVFMLATMSKDKNIFDKNIPPQYITSFFTLGILFFFFSSLIMSIGKRSTQFFMSDVNMAFTSPIKPQNLLIYEFIKSISSAGVFLLVFLYQIPNLKINLGLSSMGIFLIILILGLFFITLSIISIFIYSLCSTKPYLNKIFNIVFKGAAALTLLFPALKLFQNKDDLFNTFVNMFSSKNIDYIPLIGWYKAMFNKAITNVDGIFFVYALLNILVIGILAVILYNMNLDYYEDVIQGAELKEDVLKLKTKQINPKEFNLNNRKLKTRKITYNYNANYGKTIFYKHILEYRKTGFGILNLYTLLMVSAAVIYGKFVPINDILPLLYGYIYISGLASFGNKIHQEMAKPYIFLIPDSQESKIFWGTLSSALKFLVDGSLSFLVAGILTKSNPLTIVLAIIVYVSFGFVFIYGGVLNYRLFGRIASNALKGFLMFISIFVYVLPGIIASIIISMKLEFLGQYAIYFSFIIWNMLVSLVIMQFAKGVLNHCELD